MEIIIVPDAPCPGCGAYWGHPDPTLDFPNRIKVDDHWKCYNPDCPVGFYDADGTVVEAKPTPEESAAMDERVKVWAQDLTANRVWVQREG